MPRTEPGLITTAQASKVSGKNWRTIIRLVERGELTPAQKLPGLRGAYLFHPTDIEGLKDEEASQRSRTA
ncbi:helix-turn-helix DNA binding domain protein [Arthrobacter phage Gusanita]|nr:helix-turn-helix DNA binding domain protein [Arthrobacter phage Gusanita]